MLHQLMRLVCASRGALRDAIRKLVSAELDRVVESQPPTEYTNYSTGEVRSIKDERKIIIKNHISELFRGYRYLDAPRKLSVKLSLLTLSFPILHLPGARFQKRVEFSDSP